MVLLCELSGQMTANHKVSSGKKKRYQFSKMDGVTSMGFTGHNARYVAQLSESIKGSKKSFTDLLC